MLKNFIIMKYFKKSRERKFGKLKGKKQKNRTKKATIKTTTKTTNNQYHFFFFFVDNSCKWLSFW